MVADLELRALLVLRSLPRLGDRRLGELMRRHGSARAVLDAPASELGEAAAMARHSAVIEGRVDRVLRVIEREGIEVLTQADARYPSPLHELHDPPQLLFAFGRLDLLSRPALAIVGARRPSSYGRDLAEGLATGVSRAGLVVVSGMARGIDGIAHEAALGGGTIGVLGCGIDVVYPHENSALFRRVRDDGLLLSEFMPGEPPLRYHFPRRNRLIAALSAGVLVVEATRRSGTLITVDHALDLGREVMAVPGPIGRDLSVGTNELLRDGATIVLGVGDVLAALEWVVGDLVAAGSGADRPGSGSDVRGGLRGGIQGDAMIEGRGGSRGGDGSSPPPGVAGVGLRLWSALEVEPRHAEVVARESGLDAATTLAGLLELEISGHVRQLPGLRFVRRLEPGLLR